MTEETDVKKALNDFFGIGGENKRFFDATQIPRICSDISGIRISMHDIVKAVEKKDSDYESRIRELEKFHYNLNGKLAIVGVLASIAGGIVTTLISHFIK